MHKASFIALGILMLACVGVSFAVAAVPPGESYANCAEVPEEVLGGRTCVEVSECGVLTGSDQYWLLVNDVSTPMTCMWIDRGENSVFDLNKHTITYAAVDSPGLSNGDFEKGTTEGWDFSDAPAGSAVADDYIRMSGSHLAKFTDPLSPQTIVSEWIPISLADRPHTYTAYAMFKDCNYRKIEVELSGGTTVCSAEDTDRCTFKPEAAGNYRVKITVKREGSGICYVDLVNVRPTKDVGITITRYTDLARFPDYMDHSAGCPADIEIKNGSIVEAAPGSFFGKTIYNNSCPSSVVRVHHIYSESHGLDSRNYLSEGGKNQDLHDNTFVNTNTFTTNRHALIGPLNFGTGSNNRLFNSVIEGGQGGVYFTSSTDFEIFGNTFRTSPNVANHFGVVSYKSSNGAIYNNVFEQTGPGVFLSTGTRNVEVYRNRFNLTAMPCLAEYPTGITTMAFRVSDYNAQNPESQTRDNLIYDNVIFGTAQKFPQFPKCRPKVAGFHLSTGGENNVYYNNYIDLVSGEGAGAHAVDVSGLPGDLVHNVFRSNELNMWLADGYGGRSSGGYFERNAFVKSDADDLGLFRNIRVGYCCWDAENRNHFFHSNVYRDGADIDDINFTYNSWYEADFEYFRQWGLKLFVHDGEGRAVAGADIEVSSDGEALEEVSDEAGRAALTLTEHRGYVPVIYYGNPEITPYTPHDLAVAADGFSSFARSIEMNSSKSLAVNLRDGSVNYGPVLEYIDYFKFVDANEVLEFRANATDPEGDPLTFSSSELPIGAEFEDGVFRWRPEESQRGMYKVVLSATDGLSSDEAQMTIVVGGSTDLILGAGGWNESGWTGKVSGGGSTPGSSGAWVSGCAAGGRGAGINIVFLLVAALLCGLRVGVNQSAVGHGGSGPDF